ncbi:MAG: hypothetical protein KA354_17130 [Phycisphaerae bacterium]|nr:hypothetical protein [Phycisphaerae bacterium]
MPGAGVVHWWRKLTASLDRSLPEDASAVPKLLSLLRQTRRFMALDVRGMLLSWLVFWGAALGGLVGLVLVVAVANYLLSWFCLWPLLLFAANVFGVCAVLGGFGGIEASRRVSSMDYVIYAALCGLPWLFYRHCDLAGWLYGHGHPHPTMMWVLHILILSIALEAGWLAYLAKRAVTVPEIVGELLRRLYMNKLRALLAARVQALDGDEESAPGQALCGPCLSRVELYTDRLLGARYYRCRSCRRDYPEGDDWESFEEVVAILHQSWNSASMVKGGRLYVNADKRDGLFDFDRVEIHEADDVQVERFVMAVSNDPDAERRSRRRRCTINPQISLSQHTAHMLDAVFQVARTQHSARALQGEETGA